MGMGERETNLHQLTLAGSAILRSRDEDVPTELTRFERLHAVVDDEHLGVVEVLAVEPVVLVVGEAGEVPSLQMLVLITPALRPAQLHGRSQVVAA